MEYELSEPMRILEEEVANFYKLTSRYFRGYLINPYGKEMYKRELENLLDKAHRIITDNQFEDLVLKNTISNLELNDVVVNFCSDPSFPHSTQQFIDRLGGEGTWDYLENSVRTAPWELRWKHGEMTQERDFATVNPHVPEAKEAALEWLPRIKEDILNYGKEKGHLPQDFDMAILLLPPESGNWSSWNSKNGVFQLGTYGFDFFQRDGKTVAVPAVAYQVAFHEVLGHAAHQIGSQSLPKSLRFSEEVGSISPTKSVTEGLAIKREEECSEFLKENLERLCLNNEEITLLENERMFNIQGRIERFYYGLVKERELREEGFDGYKYFLDLTNNPVLAHQFKHDFKDTFVDVWRILGHALGQRHYEIMKTKIRNEFGDEFIQGNIQKLHLATLRGVWSYKIYPEAVAYFLREARD